MAGQHRNLAAVVCVVRNEVGGKTCDVGTESLNATVAVQGSTHDHAESVAALLQGAEGLRGRHLRAIELRRKLDTVALLRPGCGFQPHDAHVVHVRNDGRDGAALAAERSTPDPTEEFDPEPRAIDERPRREVEEEGWEVLRRKHAERRRAAGA